MDIEGGRGDNYPVFIKEYQLRKLMDNDPKRNYLITGAPQCPYPDHYLGPERPGSGNRAVFLFVVWKYKKKILNYFGDENNRMQLWRFEKQQPLVFVTAVVISL